jgi:mannitol/fructose-specific phosphotransferase system IIA component (Ntr-type)
MIENLAGSCLIVPRLESTSKEEVFQEMLDKVVEAGHITKRDRTAMKKLLIEREAQGSTGLGNGIAVPHLKSKKLTEHHLVIANSEDGIQFGAIDGQPVHTLFLVMGPADDPESHLQVLRWASSLARSADFRRFVLSATSEAEIRDLLEEMSGA